jgi:beta-mannosidase
MAKVITVSPVYITSNSRHSQGRELEQTHGKLNLWNGDSSRLHVRKAQYK